MNRAILKRLAVLEERFKPPPPGKRYSMVWMMHALAPEVKANLGDSERIVGDVFRDFNGIGWAAERITSDPNDNGRDPEPGGYLEDVIREIHQTCSHRDCMEGCRVCEGTPVAKELCVIESVNGEPDGRASNWHLILGSSPISRGSE